MDGGELQLEDEEQLWDPVRDEVPKATEGGDQEEPGGGAAERSRSRIV